MRKCLLYLLLFLPFLVLFISLYKSRFLFSFIIFLLNKLSFTFFIARSPYIVATDFFCTLTNIKHFRCFIFFLTCLFFIVNQGYLVALQLQHSETLNKSYDFVDSLDFFTLLHGGKVLLGSIYPVQKQKSTITFNAFSGCMYYCHCKLVRKTSY